MEAHAQEPSNTDNTFDHQITQWEHRDALCTLTKLVDSVPVLDARILELQRLLDRAATVMAEVVPELREAYLIRENLEVDYFEKMKVKKELYDGTAQLETESRRFRIRWLKVERKKTRVAKWEKQNLFNRQNDLEDSDYEKYS
jgi:hypothetical protein